MSIRKNTALNLVGAVIPMGVMLVTVPLYLKVLGDARYGVLALVWLALGYFSFLEMGLGKAAANQIAEAHAAPASERSEIFWSALLVNSAMGLAGAAVLWFTGRYLLTQFFTLPAGFEREAVAALPWIVATFPLALATSVLNGSLEGRNQFLVMNILQVVGNMVFQVAPLIAAYRLGPSLAIVIPAAVLSRAVMNVPLLIVCYRVVPFLLPPHFSVQRVRHLFSYGGGVAVASLMGPVLETLDRVLIGAVLGAQAVAHYTIAYQLSTKVRVLPASLLRALFPRFSADVQSAKPLAQQAALTLTAVMTPVTVFGILVLGPFLSWWVGDEVAKHALPVACIILVGVWANSLAYVPLGLLQGVGRPDLVAKAQLAELVPFIAILYVAILEWGVIGAAITWSLRVSVDALLLYWLAGLASRSARALLAPITMVFMALGTSLLQAHPRLQTVCVVLLTAWLAQWLSTTAVGDIVRLQLRSRTQGPVQ